MFTLNKFGAKCTINKRKHMDFNVYIDVVHIYFRRRRRRRLKFRIFITSTQMTFPLDDKKKSLGFGALSIAL